MSELSITEMLGMQRKLQEKYKGHWEPVCPETGRNKLLWMVGEIGEVSDIIKKCGDEAICTDPAVRAHFVEEMADVLMFYHDVMLCYDISPEELEEIYRAKAARNLTRWNYTEEDK